MNSCFYLSIYTDGGARGNPGEAAYGFVVYDENKNIVFKKGEKIGIATNNTAEYRGVIESLKWININHPDVKQINFYLDSNLVVSQLSGTFKIKSETLRDYYYSIKSLEEKLDTDINYFYIPRENNKEADKLVNLALDNKI